MEGQTYWRKCGSCKKEIGFNTIYQSCSVSSCSKFVFCSVECWDMHNPVMNHKSAWAEENRSPMKSEGKRIIITQPISGQTKNNTFENDFNCISTNISITLCF